MASSSQISVEDLIILNTMKHAGYTNNVKITDTLQGSIWRSLHKISRKRVAIKVTDRYLHKQGVVVVNNRPIIAHENIKKETIILQTLTKDKKCPDSLVKYIEAFKTQHYYFLVMEDGGHSLMHFVRRAHRCITEGTLDISEWHKICKNIFKQMVHCIEYIHSKNVAHLDISLENFVINNIEIDVYTNQKMRFVTDSMQVKLCDFGIAELFGEADAFRCNKYCGKSNYKSPEIISHKKNFSAKSNDIWALGVCFFMMIVGNSPWKKASKHDIRFKHIFINGDIVRVISLWKKSHYVNDDIVHLFSLFFKLEDERINIETLKQCKWSLNEVLIQ